ncbi:hypothetical protein B0T19DRAFT_405337 [Cercophora scortea]|uniref:BTB domain-containing protein n=1 Tax=Cercophora scortea TaxID=314031 RepID=A0AAE0M3T2_9PEZI|nr:hypothetical protein B0T19DRAFT_405337 [Cercophora scortea]
MFVLYESLRALYKIDKFSDLTVQCGDLPFKLHRVIVCPQSKYLDDLCSNPEGLLPEAWQSTSILEKVIQFLYTGNYEDEEYPNAETVADAATLSAQEAEEELQAAWLCVGTGGLVHDEAHTLDLDWRQSRDSDTEGDGEGAGDDELDFSTEGEGEDVESNARIAGKGLVENGQEEADEEEEEEDDDTADETMDTTEIADDMEDGYIIDTPHAMFTSMAVYDMADKFGIPPLKLLAQERFFRSVERHVLSPDFPAVVDMLFTESQTAPGLKEICARFIHLLYENAEFRETMDPLIAKHPELALGVLNNYRLATKSMKTFKGRC